MPWGKSKRKEETNNCAWMSKLPPDCQNIPLWNLAIPGSHDSMSYDLDVNSSIVEPDQLIKLSGIPCVRKIVRRWAITQEKTIKQQLDAGVRYFDLRIAHKPRDKNNPRFYFYHGLYTHSDVETILRVINEWADRNPKEILILSLSHFKGFDKEHKDHLHFHLTNFIKALFGTKLIHNHEIPTLKYCWENKKNVIVSYDYQPNQHPELWSKIIYFYGNTMKSTEIEKTLQHNLDKQKPNKGFYVCGLNLTLPSDAGILKYILRICGSFTTVIQKSLPKLISWVKTSHVPMNIIASDLVTWNNFVPTVINLNYGKH
ncbi:PI-PLC X domain-containing protein 1-like [Thalassophryne amazonica]|uniref:PI-PLC X domain-containing protein 1-like n=1 Tax=Thalassophryne amazonica TaxID=390379 RepID=UPI0014713724|nr:PI-PLC X domain-containing protein 1-like [Thalassophryne amazonica]